MPRNTRLGVVASLSASVMFGLISLLTAGLGALTAEQITAWRIVSIVALMSVFFTLTHRWDALRRLAAKLRARPVVGVVVLAFTSSMVTVQLWLFIWGAMHGHALDVSLGYFLMPLMMAVVGRVLFHDRITGWQQAAVVCAAIAVTLQVWVHGGLSWVAMIIFLGYPLYFAVRRAGGIDDVTMYWVEMVVAAPVALIVLLTPVVGTVLAGVGDAAWWSLMATGLLSGAAMMAYILASGQLSLTLFGLLSYLEPVLLFVVALLLGERPGVADLGVYGIIVIALALLGVSAVRSTPADGRAGDRTVR